MASSEPANAATTIPRELTIIPFPEERSWSVPRQVWLRRKSQAHTVLQSDSGKTLQQETGYGKCPSEQNCSNDTGQANFPDNLIQCGIRLVFCQHAQKIKKDISTLPTPIFQKNKTTSNPMITRKETR